MTKQFQKIALALLLLTAMLSSCVNLKHIADFSSSSLVSVKQFEEINYSFKQNCIENCQDKKINNLNLSSKDCDCSANEKADSVTLLIYNAVKGYLDGLNKLSNNELTKYKIDALNKVLAEGNFGSVKIEKTQVEAYSSISNTLLRAFTDEYRKHKLKDYLKAGNEPFKVLVQFLDFNLSANLMGKLNVQKQRKESNYFDLTKDTSLSSFEKRKVVEEYFQELGKIEAKQKQLITYSKSLKIIVEAHQKLVDNIDKMTKNEIKEQLTQYASSIQDIISEFNKLKK